MGEGGVNINLYFYDNRPRNHLKNTYITEFYPGYIKNMVV